MGQGTNIALNPATDFAKLSQVTGSQITPHGVAPVPQQQQTPTWPPTPAPPKPTLAWIPPTTPSVGGSLGGNQALTPGGQFGEIYNPMHRATQLGLDPRWADPFQSGAREPLMDLLDPLGGQSGGALGFGLSRNVLDPDANPYLQRYGQAMIDPIFENLRESTLPYIRSQAIGAGGRGGSRQALAESGAIGQATDSAANALQGLYSQSYGQGLGHQAQMAQLLGQLQQGGVGLYDQMRQGGLGSIARFAGLAPQTIQTGMLPAQMMRALGGEQEARIGGALGQMQTPEEANQQRLEAFMRAIQGNYGSSSTKSASGAADLASKTVGRRLAGGIGGGLGGALSGAGLAASGISGWGLPLAAIGALGGLLA